MHGTFTIFGMDFPAYFTMLMGGYTFVILLAHRDWLKQGRDSNAILDLGIMLIIAGLLGARLLHVVADGRFDEYVNLCRDPYKVEGEAISGGRACVTDNDCIVAKKGGLCEPKTGLCHPERDCLRAFKFWYGGLTFYGGFALAAFLGIAYIRRKRLPLLEICDLGGYAIPLGLVFGRIGCFLAGCCFGTTCAAPPGVAFPKGSPAWKMHVDGGLIPKTAVESLPVHPTQLYEAAACLVIFGYLYFVLRPRKRFSGQLFAVFCMAYAVARFAVEFLRADERGWIGWMSTSQAIGVPLFVIGAVVYFMNRNKGVSPVAAPEIRQTEDDVRA